MALTTTYEKFTHQLGDIYDAELRFSDLYREMAEQATDARLQEALRRHVEETQQHVQNIGRVYDLLEETHERETCEAAQGIVQEARRSIREAGNGPLRDWSIKVTVDRTDHYEIAAYQSLITHARMANRSDIADLLRQNLQQEEGMAHTAEEHAEELLRAAMQANP